jgi:hypothetical protein
MDNQILSFRRSAELGDLEQRDPQLDVEPVARGIGDPELRRGSSARVV